MTESDTKLSVSLQTARIVYALSLSLSLAIAALALFQASGVLS